MGNDIARSLQNAITGEDDQGQLIRPPESPMAGALRTVSAGVEDPGQANISQMMKAIQVAKDELTDKEAALRKDERKFTSGPLKSKAGNVALKLGHGISEGWKRAMNLKYGTKMKSNLPELKKQQDRRIQQALAKSKNAAETIELMGTLGMKQAFADRIDKRSRDRDAQATHDREARMLGIKTEDKDGNPRPQEEIDAEVIQRNAEKAETAQTAAEVNLRRQQTGEAGDYRQLARQEIDTAIESNDFTGISERTIQAAGMSWAQAYKLADQAKDERTAKKRAGDVQLEAAQVGLEGLKTEVKIADERYDDPDREDNILRAQWRKAVEIADARGERRPPKPITRQDRLAVEQELAELQLAGTKAELENPDYRDEKRLEIWANDARTAAIKGQPMPEKPILEQDLMKARAASGDSYRERVAFGRKNEAMQEARSGMVGLRATTPEMLAGGADDGKPMDPNVGLVMMLEPLVIAGLVKSIKVEGQDQYVPSENADAEVVALYDDIMELHMSKFPEFYQQTAGPAEGGPRGAKVVSPRSAARNQ